MLLLTIVAVKAFASGLFFGLAFGVVIERRHRRRVELARVWRPRHHFASWGEG